MNKTLEFSNILVLWYLNNKRDFLQIPIEQNIIIESFNFAYNMVFGEGYHRKHRSGGQYSRKNGELFANTFQGKIAEFVVYNEFIKVDCKLVYFTRTGRSSRGTKAYSCS